MEVVTPCFIITSKELNVAICKLEWRHQHVHRPYMCPQGPLSVVKRRVYLVLAHEIVASI